MKILEIIPQLSQGGAERFVVDLCNELSVRHNVTLVVLHNIDRTGFFLEEISKRVKVISMNKRKGFDLSLFFKIRNLIKKENPDIVHTHLRAIVYSLLAYLVPSHTKYIHTVHNDAVKEAGDGISRICRKFAFKTKRVIPVTISEESKKSFIDFYGITPPMIYNGRPAYKESAELQKVKYELDSLRTNSDVPMIVNIARVCLQKNQLILAKAIEELNQRGKNVELAIIGRIDNSPYSEELQDFESTHVHLLGTRNNPRDYMKVADAFCLSSLYEGMPITLIECFSVGTIPICTPVGGIKNMIEDGKNGILSAGVSQREIKESLMRFLDLSLLKKKEIGRNSMQSFELYNMETCITKYEYLMNSFYTNNI